MYVVCIMTKLTYRGVVYFKEQEAAANRAWWNLVHRADLWLCYRGGKYRPIQVGGLI